MSVYKGIFPDGQTVWFIEASLSRKKSRPASTDPREGQQDGVDTNAFLKSTPSDAMRSKPGVETNFEP